MTKNYSIELQVSESCDIAVVGLLIKPDENCTAFLDMLNMGSMGYKVYVCNQRTDWVLSSKDVI